MAPTETSAVGMAGHIFAALLETAGLFSLSQILDNAGDLLLSLGYFAWVWCAVGAVISVVMFGGYKRALYLLVGPALFFWMLQTRVPVTHAPQQFGERPGKQADQQLEILDKSFEGAPSRTANIPLFVAVYDRVVSSFMQQIVAMLVDTKNKQDMIAAARERMMSRVLLSRGSDPEFLRLLSTSLLGDCSKELNLRTELATPRLADAKAGSVEAVERETKKIELSKLEGRKNHMDDRLKQFVKRIGHTPAENPTCDDIWNYTKTACIKAAEGAFTPTDKEKAEYTLSDPQWRVVADFVKQKLTSGTPGSTDTALAAKVLAAYYLKNSANDTLQAGLVRQMEGRRGFDDHQAKTIFGDVAASEAEGAHILVVYFASVVPYVQGLILYLLLISFPFFAIFLLIPSKIESFATWLGLWAWVKSWDVGFALVAFLKDTFWELLPQAGNERTTAAFTQLNWDDPNSVLNFVYQNDPTMSLNTYYTVIGVLTLAIPYVTAQFCLGAAELYESIKPLLENNAREIASRRVSAGRVWRSRKLMTDMEMKKALAGERGFNRGLENPGTLTGRNIPRDKTGDASLGNHAMREAVREQFRYSFSSDNMKDIGALAGHHGRRISGTPGAAKDIVGADINEFNEMFVGNSPLGGITGDNSSNNQSYKSGDTAPKASNKDGQ